MERPDSTCEIITVRYDKQMVALNLLIKQKAFEAGFDMVGIAPLRVSWDLDFARQWVEHGYGGEMHYLQDPKRDDPRQILPSARSVVCVGLIYNSPLPYSTEVRGQEPEAETASVSSRRSPDARADGPRRTDSRLRAWISRYAWGRDYHDVMRKKLEQLRLAIEHASAGAETRVYVDTGPVVERAFARHSGIGWMGKNTCLISPAKGSWFFLGVLLTNLHLEPDFPAADRCGSCARCLDACPTGALVKPYVMDASRCIAYFTIELKGFIPEKYRPAIGSNVFGCDICQDVCPWNRRQKAEARSQNDGGSCQPSAVGDQTREKGLGRVGAATTTLPEFQPIEVDLRQGGTGMAFEGTTDEGQRTTSRFSLFNPRLENLAVLSDDDFRRAFARSPIKRTKYRAWLRNLCVVMGNSGDRRFIPKLEALARHDDPIVREHAQWALDRLPRV